MSGIYYGIDEQKSVSRRPVALFELLKVPKLTWYGRASCCGISTLGRRPSGSNGARSGAAPMCWVPRQHIEDFIVAVEAPGIMADIF